MSAKTENKVSSALQLLEARKEALTNLQRTNMKAHGKLWGKDFFTWEHPDTHSLANTISTFPYPMAWVTDRRSFELMQLDHPALLQELHCILVLDNTQEELKTDQLLVEILDSSADVFDKIKDIHIEKFIVLISASAESWPQFENLIEVIKN